MKRDQLFILSLGLTCSIALIGCDSSTKDKTSSTAAVNKSTSNDSDSDNDGIADNIDNCLTEANPLQEDSDDNGVGDVCEVKGTVYDDLGDDDVVDSTGDTPDEGDDTVVTRTPSCLAIGSSYLGQNDGSIQLTADVSASWLKYYGITGVGASAASNTAQGIYVEMKRMRADGTLNTLDTKEFRYGNVSYNEKGEKFISLPTDYVATGFGFAVNSTGDNIEAARISGVKLNSLGQVVDNTECMTDRFGNFVCAHGVSLIGDSATRFREYSAPVGKILKGLGLRIGSNNVLGIWSQIAAYSSSTSCSNSQ